MARYRRRRRIKKVIRRAVSIPSSTAKRVRRIDTRPKPVKVGVRTRALAKLPRRKKLVVSKVVKRKVVRSNVVQSPTRERMVLQKKPQRGAAVKTVRTGIKVRRNIMNVICDKRKQRKQVMFALNPQAMRAGGAPGRSGRYKRNERSNVKCPG